MAMSLRRSTAGLVLVLAGIMAGCAPLLGMESSRARHSGIPLRRSSDLDAVLAASRGRLIGYGSGGNYLTPAVICDDASRPLVEVGIVADGDALASGNASRSHAVNVVRPGYPKAFKVEAMQLSCVR